LEASYGKWTFDRCMIRGARGVPESEMKKLVDRIKCVERKTVEVEILKEAVRIGREKN
jgi:hypothetical protein